MATGDSEGPQGAGQPSNKFYKATDQTFTKGSGSNHEQPASENIGGGVGGIAPVLPLQGRLLASLIANSLTGLSLGARILLTVATVIFIVREMVETRRDWYAGSNSVEQVELTRIQQQREQAEVIVAKTAARKNLQEELTAIVQRETADLQAVKADIWSVTTDLFPFGRGVQLNAAYSRTYRYKELEDQAKQKVDECRKSNACSEIELRSLDSTVDLYRMLKEDARAGYTAMTGPKSVDHPLFTQQK